jgi:group I intron endonuclease
MNYAGAGYVYAITNTVNGRQYIGSTVNYKQRWGDHRRMLRRDTHHSFVLQRAWNKYGEAAFKFELLVVCPKELRVEYENRLMATRTYNVLRTAREAIVRRGRRHSEATKSKMSAAHKGKVFSAEWRANMADAARRRMYDAEFSRKASERQRGVTPSAQTRARLSAAVTAARAAEAAHTRGLVHKIYLKAAQGGKIGELCGIYGITTTTFYKHCRDLGLPNLKQRLKT